MIRAGIAGVALLAFMQTSPGDRLRTQSLGVSDNLYLVSGGGGNSLLMAADTGGVIVDAKAAGHGRTLNDIASGISDQPITTAIYTHAHADHTAGAVDLPTLRRIIAHENTKTQLARLPSFAGPAARFLPETTFADRLSLGEGLDRIDLRYLGPAHTSGDIVVIFPAKRTAYLGDLFPGRTLPVIDTANGGSGLAWSETLAKAVPELQGIVRIIPGHAVPPAGSPLPRWFTTADLQEYVAFTRDLASAVREAFKAGKTANEAAASLTLREKYPTYTFDGLSATVAAIYGELR
jgi:cyclase